jgi:hypothetical protein
MPNLSWARVSSSVAARSSCSCAGLGSPARPDVRSSDGPRTSPALASFIERQFGRDDPDRRKSRPEVEQLAAQQRRLALDTSAATLPRRHEPHQAERGDDPGHVRQHPAAQWTRPGQGGSVHDPDRPWIEFARTLPAIVAPRVGLFTTYKLASGSMFSQMRKHLASKIPAIGLELRSRTGRLSEADKRVLERFLTGA